jgi:hypothetical protein
MDSTTIFTSTAYGIGHHDVVTATIRLKKTSQENGLNSNLNIPDLSVPDRFFSNHRTDSFQRILPN